MPTFLLGPKELDKYAELFALTELIDKSYIHLYNLEVSGKKDSEEYTMSINNLKKLLVKERKAYDCEMMTTDLCQAFTALILQTKTPKQFPGNMESLVTMTEEAKHSRRILTKLSTKFTNNTEVLQRMLPSGVREMLNSLGVDDVEKIVKSGISTSVRIQQALDKDTLTLFLATVEEYKGKNGLSSFSNSFTKVKYMTAFITEDIEKDMISSSFTVPESVYVGSRFIADMLNVVNEAFIAIKNIYGIEIANAQLNRILELDDYSYMDSNKNIEAILRQSLLRAILFLASSDVVENLENDFKEHTDNVDDNSTRRISISIIEEAFKNISKDKSKHMIFSLRPDVIF